MTPPAVIPAKPAPTCFRRGESSVFGRTTLGAARLDMHAGPGEQITAVAHYCYAHSAACNVVGVYVFSFGGVPKTAEWINRLITCRTQI